MIYKKNSLVNLEKYQDLVELQDRSLGMLGFL